MPQVNPKKRAPRSPMASGLQPFQHLVPKPVLRPAAKAFVDRLPRPETLWEVTPRHACRLDPQNTVHDQPMIGPRTARAVGNWHHVGNQAPLLVGQSICSRTNVLAFSQSVVAGFVTWCPIPFTAVCQPLKFRS